MRGKLKALVGAIAAFGLAFSLAAPLGGCGAEDAGDKLTVWVRDSDYRSYVETAFLRYERETGNSLAVKVIPESSFDNEVEAAFKSGQGPDVLMHYNDSDLVKLGIADNFLTLNDQVWADTLMAGARAYCDDGEGNLIGLPFWESSVSGCYYNKAILDGLGLKPASTQAEFDRLCQALESVGITPLFWGDQCGWMYQLGLDPIFADNPELLAQLNAGEITYADIPEVRSMVQWIDDANKKGWLGNPRGLGYDDVSAPLASGETAMVDIWDTWFETDFAPGTYGPDDFAIMPVFMGTAERGTYEGGNLNMMLVNKNARHLDSAVELLEFCASPDVVNEAFAGVPSVKVFQGQNTVVTSDMLVDAASSLAKLQRVSTAQPKILGYNQEDMKAAFTALLNGQVDVDGCLALMDEARLAAQS